jgi:hypothetical protein
MKKLLFTLIVIFTVTTFSQGQGVELTGFYGYQTAASVNVFQGKLKARGAENFGAALDISLPFSESSQIELLYIHQDTQLDLDPFVGADTKLFDASVEYYQIGVVKRILQAGPVVPFGAFTAGWATINPDEAGRSSESRFAMTAGAGAKIYFGKVGLRLQARLLAPIQWGSGGLFCGSGGCSVGVGATTSIIQADFTGGVFLSLGDNN